ncbi:MAG: efflux RND transporter permease subunit [Rhodothermales bacterium]
MTLAALKRPVTTMMVFVCLMLIGGIATQLIPMEYFPDVSEPEVNIDIPYPGGTPQEVEREIVRPLEEALATISGVSRIRANANENNANISLEFPMGEDMSLRSLEVREKIDGVRDQLPDDVERIYVRQFSMADIPVLMMRISSERDLSGAYELLNRRVKNRIERLEGVSQVELYGVNPKEIRIELDAGRIAAHRVDLGQLSQALQRSNFSSTGGRISDAGKRYVVRAVGELTSVEQVGNLPIGQGDLRVRDIANVIYDDPRMEEGRHLDGSYAIGMNISKEGSANTVEVADRVVAELEQIKDDPELDGVTLLFMENQADGIVQSLNELLKSGALGGVLALVVLFFFLRQWAPTFIVSLAVPISIVITVGALYFFGVSLNVLSMMGLMLAIGMLVDNAVVVTESIQRVQQQMPNEPRKATIQGVKEVALAVTAGTLTTAIVFLPAIVSPADEVTLYLSHVSIAICVALAVSLAISLTVVPILTARLKLKPKTETQKANYVDRLEAWYAGRLRWLINHRGWSVLLVVGTLVSVAIPLTFVNTDFFPDGDAGREIRLFYHVNGNYQLERIEEAVDRVEAYLFENQDEFEITSVYSYFRTGFATSTLTLTDGKDIEKTTDEIQALIRENMPKLAIANPTFSWRSGRNEDRMSFVIQGESSEVLAELSFEIARVIDRMPGFNDVRSDAEQGREEVRIAVDRERAAQYGMNTQQVAANISSAMRGQNLRRFRTADGEVTFRMEFQGSDQQSLEDLQNLTLAQGSDAPVQLAAVADFTTKAGPRGIYRENRETMLRIRANLDGLTNNEARDEIRKVMNQFELPEGYTWSFGGRFFDEQTSENIMLTNLLLALILIYLVMAGLFESLIHPAAIWSSIVFAIVGVYWFFLITGTTFSVMAWIGVLILVGVVVNNGIVLIDHINNLRAEGLPRTDAIVRAGRERLRPIIMTALTTILGLIPLCITNTQIGGDGPPYYPMARAIVGGLAFSTVVTLILLPTIYIWLDDLRYWGRRIAHASTTR